MPLFPCPECLNLVSTEAIVCPFCDAALEAIDENEYEVKSELVFCRGLGSWNAIMEPLAEDIDDGWEIAAVVGNPYQSTVTRTAFDVLLKREKNETASAREDASGEDLDGEVAAQAYEDIEDFCEKIARTATADLQLILEDQADLYTDEEMAVIKAELVRRGKSF